MALLLIFFICYIFALDELRLHTQMQKYPKLPPLKSNEIEWDPVDSTDFPAFLPPASGVSRSQTRRQHDDRPFRATKPSNVKMENPLIQSEFADAEPKVRGLKVRTQ
jgi:hypothetical protein